MYNIFATILFAGASQFRKFFPRILRFENFDFSPSPLPVFSFINFPFNFLSCYLFGSLLLMPFQLVHLYWAVFLIILKEFRKEREKKFFPFKFCCCIHNLTLTSTFFFSSVFNFFSLFSYSECIFFSFFGVSAFDVSKKFYDSSVFYIIFSKQTARKREQKYKKRYYYLVFN